MLLVLRQPVRADQGEIFDLIRAKADGASGKQMLARWNLAVDLCRPYRVVQGLQ